MYNHALLLFFLMAVLTAIYAEEKRSWTDEDGVEVEIIKKISESKCKVKTQAGDHLEQYFKLTDNNGKVVGSNFGLKP